MGGGVIHSHLPHQPASLPHHRRCDSASAPPRLTPTTTTYASSAASATQHFLHDATQALCSISGMCVPRYPADHRGYRCYDITSRRVYTSRHVTFVEDVCQDGTHPPSTHAAAPVQDDEDDVPSAHVTRRRVHATVPTAAPSSTPRHTGTSTSPALHALPHAAASLTSPRVPPAASSPTVQAPTHASPPAATSPSPARASPTASLTTRSPPCTSTSNAAESHGPAQRQHHMITRACVGVFRPNHKYALTTSSPVSCGSSVRSRRAPRSALAPSYAG